MTKKLRDNGYIFVEEFLDYQSCDKIIKQFREAETDSFYKGIVNLNDSDDKFNTIYKSSRSPLRYCYLKTDETQEINRIGIKKLNDLTELDWKGNINDACFPIFEYGLGGYIEAHRGRDIGYGENDFVAVLMLTEYDGDFSGGEFYLNPNASVSSDGKTIFDEDTSSRMYFKQNKGSLLIFNNRKNVHGTLPVKISPNGSSLRMTTSWRMAEE